jgi:adenylate kinase family enzyme
MKIAIIGYSGSGKSTLARILAKQFHAAVLHLDSVHYLPNWVVRNDEEKKKIVKEFLDSHDSWVIDGNYSSLFYEQRMTEADTIVMLLFNRCSCLRRVHKRYVKYKNTTRPDMADGCNEKLDSEFVKWILWKGRTKRAKERYKGVISKYGKKVVVIQTQKELDKYIRSLNE